MDLLGLSVAERGRARGDVCTAHVRFGIVTARAARMEQLKQRAAEEEETRKMKALEEEQKGRRQRGRFLKVLSILTLLETCTRVLTVQNFSKLLAGL